MRESNITTLVDIIDNLRDSLQGIVFISHNVTKHYSYSNLWVDVGFRIRSFDSQGVRRGDRVMVSLKSIKEHVVTFLSLVYMGAVPVSVKPSMPSNANEYLRYLQTVACQQGAVFQCKELPSIPGCQALDCDQQPINTRYVTSGFSAEPQDIAFIQYTSGSTGAPKPIAISHEAICANLKNITNIDGRDEKTVGFSFLPLSHDMGLVGGLLSNLYLANKLLLTDVKYFLRQPYKCLSIAKRHGANVMAAPNFLLSYIVKVLGRKKPKDLNGLFNHYTTIYIGAEPIRKETITRFLKVCIPLGLQPHALYFCYGLAEATLIVAGHRFHSIESSFNQSLSGKAAACIGNAVDGVEIKIETRDKDDPIGNILIKGKSVFNGYDGESDHCQVWFDTGDVGYKVDGKFYVIGRAADTAIVNGRNLYATDIENSFMGSNSVKNCFAVTNQENIYLFFVSQHGKGLCRKDLEEKFLSDFGVLPTEMYQLPYAEIPKTTSGKPMRRSIYNELDYYEKWRLMP